jgi:acyl-CoA thioester hydrolase
MVGMALTTWSAPVRFAEVDAQDVVFNAHYLTWCDEAMNQLFVGLGLRQVAVDVRLVTTTMTWRSSAAWGDTVEVDVDVVRIGSTSLTLGFEVRVLERVCCTVETVYVHVGPDGRPTPVPDEVRAALSAPAR